MPRPGWRQRAWRVIGDRMLRHQGVGIAVGIGAVTRIRGQVWSIFTARQVIPRGLEVGLVHRALKYLDSKF